MALTIKEVAARYAVSEPTVAHWVHSGQLKAMNMGRDPGKIKPRWKITEKALAEFELARTTTPSQPKTPRLKLRSSGARRHFYAEN